MRNSIKITSFKSLTCNRDNYFQSLHFNPNKTTEATSLDDGTAVWNRTSLLVPASTAAHFT